MSFGPGDISANDWGWSGGNSFWTNWGTSLYSTGSLTRVTAIAVRWGCGDNTGHGGTSATGHNDVWDSSNNLAATTGNITNTTQNTGAFNNIAASQNYWLGNASFYGGFSRTSTQQSTTPFRDGSGGNYAGKSAGDATNSGGTTNWAGVGSPGGLGWSATSTNCQVYVRRGGVWTQCNVYVMRSGAWAITVVNVWRSGAWTVANFLEDLTRSEIHIPDRGLPVEVSVDGGPRERGYLVEEGVGWFGSIDPAALGIDWHKTGSLAAPFPAPFTGRYNSREPQGVVEARLYAHDRWQRSLKAGDYAQAGYWKAMFQPELLPTMTFGFTELSIGPLARKNPIITEGVKACRF